MLKDYPQTHPANELVKMEIFPPTFLIENLIGIGSVCLLLGPPKSGKSMLALNMALAVAKRISFLGSFSTMSCGVLYISLEDNLGRLKNRLMSMVPDGEFPEDLFLTDQWGQTNEDPIKLLDFWLKMHPEVGLAVIDVLAKFSPVGTGGSYGSDYSLAAKFCTIARDHNASIIVLHHTIKNIRKDWVSGAYGTSGLTGACDAIMFLDRDRSSHSAVLHVTGRDVEDQAIDLGFEKGSCTWKKMEAADMLTPQGRRMLERFKNHPDDNDFEDVF